MAVGTTTAHQASDSSWLKTFGKILYFLFFLVTAFIIYKFSWYWGTTWLLVGALIYILFILNSDYRRFGLFVLINLAIIAFIGGPLQGLLVRSPVLLRFIQRNTLLNYLLHGYGETVFWSIVVGVIVALAITLIPLLIIAFVSAVYVLALHKMEGVSWWDAVRYIITLILGINLPYIVVESGQAMITEKAAKLGVIGGPGHLIVKQGNVVVLERGGKISRIVNAGVTNLKPLESIRNIFPLNVQSNPLPDDPPVEHVLTKDRIPLKITLKIAFQIEPAAEVDKRDESRIVPNGEALTKKFDDGLYQVYEGTIRKAALMSQATLSAKREDKKCKEVICYEAQETDWKKVAGSVPEGELRDYIMSYRFDELFELINEADRDQPGIRVNKRKIYEIEQAILAQIKPSKISTWGVLVRSIDIGKIVFPEEARNLLLEHWKEPWEQDMFRVSFEGKVKRAELWAQTTVIQARARAQARILKGQGEGEARAAFFREVLREIKREAVLGNEEMVVAVLRQLISTMVSVNDLETFVKATAYLERRSRKYPEFDKEQLPDKVGLEKNNGNNVSGSEQMGDQ